METERFSVPELLFHPADVGLMQPGVQHATLQTLSSVEDTLAEVAAGLVVLTGGNTRFPNFHHRFVTELRGSIPCDHKLQVLPCQHNIGEQPLRGDLHLYRFTCHIIQTILYGIPPESTRMKFVKDGVSLHFCQERRIWSTVTTIAIDFSTRSGRFSPSFSILADSIGKQC